MPDEARKVTGYKIILWPHKNWKADIYDGGLDFERWIRVYSADGKQNSLFFLTNRRTLPECYVTNSGAWIGFFQNDQYPYFVDLLRNESPITLGFYTENKTISLSSGIEPVGEGPGEL